MEKTPEEDVKRIAQNLSTIRDYHGDTQEYRAHKKIEGYSKHTIASYETGRRPVPEAYIMAIAKLYNIPAEFIKEQRITKDWLDDYKSKMNMDSEIVKGTKEAYEFFFNSIATSETTNKCFKIADEYCDEYRKRIQNQTIDYANMKLLPIKAMHQYYLSFSEGGILEGAANALMMLFLMYSQTNINPDMLYELLTGRLTKGEFYVQFKSMFDDMTDEKRKFIQSKQNQDILDQCLVALGSVDKGRMYAEYYTALKYMLCMIDNGRKFRENVEIGYVMMKEFSNMGNPLAKKAVAFFDF